MIGYLRKTSKCKIEARFLSCKQTLIDDTNLACKI